jgi:hypothetical protein
MRVSSMMRIVLDNTDNAVHKKTPPPSPKNPLKNTRILMPTFASFSLGAAKTTPAPEPSAKAVQAMRPHAAHVGAPSTTAVSPTHTGREAGVSPRPRSPPTSPAETTGRKRGSACSVGTAASGGNSSVRSAGSGTSPRPGAEDTGHAHGSSHAGHAHSQSHHHAHEHHTPRAHDPSSNTGHAQSQSHRHAHEHHAPHAHAHDSGLPLHRKGHGASAPVILHKQQRPDPASLKQVHPSKDVLVG